MTALKALFLTPMILPVVVLAVALYAFFSQGGARWNLGWLRDRLTSSLLFRSPFCPFPVRLKVSISPSRTRRCSAAPRPLEARIRVTLPCDQPRNIFGRCLFVPDILGRGRLLAIFMASPTLQTLPVKVWATLRQDLTPVVAAASTLLILLTILLMALVALARKVLKS